MACQLRSISLPARPNVLVQELEHALQRLRASCSSSASVAALVPPGDAYSRVEELIRLPGSRRDGDAPWRKAVEEALDASVALLDLCQLATDAVASVKQHVRASARRTHRRGDAGLPANMEAQRLLRCLTKLTKNASNAKKVVSKRLLAQNEMPPAVKVLSVAMAVTVAVLRGVVTSLYKIVDTKKRRWFYVSRFLRNDWAHHSCKELEGDGMAMDEEVFQGLEDNVVRLESGLEYLFRCLVQSRVALLNMLTL